MTSPSGLSQPAWCHLSICLCHSSLRPWKFSFTVPVAASMYICAYIYFCHYSHLSLKNRDRFQGKLLRWFLHTVHLHKPGRLAYGTPRFCGAVCTPWPYTCSACPCNEYANHCNTVVSTGASEHWRAIMKIHTKGQKQRASAGHLLYMSPAWAWRWGHSRAPFNILYTLGTATSIKPRHFVFNDKLSWVSWICFEIYLFLRFGLIIIIA